jgi:peptidoglycan hydrolase CwlO-like protein
MGKFTIGGRGDIIMDNSIDIALLLSIISVVFMVYNVLTNSNRTRKADDKSEAAQLTTVIVKLETIGNGIAEIKSEISSLKKDTKEDHERIIKLEESTKSAHKRLDTCEKYCKRFMEGTTDEK